MSEGTRRWFQCSIVVFASSATASARAQDEFADVPSEREPGKADCGRAYSAFHPVPQHCLEAIETDRPSKTDSVRTVPAGHAQVEVGLVDYELSEWRGSSDNRINLGTNIYKLGLADHLGPITHWDANVFHSVGTYGVRSRRFDPSNQVTIRTKLNVWDGKFKVTLAPSIVPPVTKGSNAEGGGFVFLNTELPFQINAELNLGAQSDTDGTSRKRFVESVATTALTRTVSGPFSVFVELYTSTSSQDFSKWNATFDVGALALLGRDWQLDAGAFVGMFGNVPSLTPFFGVSYRR